MKTLAIAITTLLMSVMLINPAIAQNQPPRQDQPGGVGPGPGPGGFNQPQPPNPNSGPGGFNQQPGPGGDFGGRGGPGQPGVRGRGRGAQSPQGPDLQKFEMLRAYIEVVDRFTAMTRSADAAGVAAVVSATDILRQRGPESAIEFLTKSLSEAKNPAVERAIRIQLADLYRQSGQSDKALEQLSVLMKAP